MAGAHKITPTNPRLSALLNDVSRGNIKIPVFQREYVWDDEQIMSLLDSIYQGYPVGSLLLWSTKEKLNHERDVGGFELPKTPEDYPVNYVLDGQQRLTTLYGVFNSDAETSDPDLAERFNVSFIPSTGEFVHSSAAHEGAINLRVILDTTKLLPELTRFSGEDQKVIAELTERFKDYEFPVVTIKDRTNQEVCRVFQRINSSGTSLSTLELLAAWTWSDQFDLRSEIEVLIDSLADKGFEQIEESLLMRCLAAISINKIDADALVDVPPATLIESMSKLKQAAYSCVDFLEKQLHVKNFVFVPFPIMLVPLIVFYSKCLKPNAHQVTSLKKWFWHCAFTQRYKAGTNSHVMTDIEKMHALAFGENPFGYLDDKVDPEIFRKTWRINSTAAKATICLFAQCQPKSFLTGQNIDLGEALSSYNSREFHHIYPKAFLASRGINFHEANIIANICLLNSSDNRAISDKDPYTYFQEINPEIKNNVFKSSLIPDEYFDGSKPYADFVKSRSELLSALAENLIKQGDAFI
ncbi:DUF262 domain-containing protein [Pseudomonas aeruginosa]|uniref:GmrSD restriction endonuclease domain-containing protein n=1 Tax=Pseudomonas aeruginosa TaxID=287 RepID=UPI0018C599E9|nr:DUF262 domain-containing protein [Pseudomonas aeruginosa]HDK9341789.1 DUF262 domain-containing protein [Staphylococcus aureus]MBG4853709.1 DUF262 domain-containing protein [Pseudomonas aeruginosa]MBG4959235.1 DUF262 domain-containing protein [Pseudomonas aeruginosa]MBG5629964.1 DUF262 domain-containing protein [Pseudomonas aeruginosa]MBG6763293.1 DUF262 domain-containing protein [Pseudomonas aeruginosa]